MIHDARRHSTAPMVRLKRGEAPGLVRARPLADGTPRWRWLPGPRQRARARAVHGFASTMLLHADGRPMGLEDAIAEARRLSAALADGQAARAPRRVMAEPSLDAALDAFIAAGQSGQVRRRSRRQGGQAVPVSARTMAGYAQALTPLRRIAGAQPLRGLRRAEVLALCEAMIADGHHHAAVATARAISRALGWLSEQPHWAAITPDPARFQRLRLGAPAGRLRMASPEEAAAMYTALKDPAGFAATLPVERRPGTGALPAPCPAAAAAWQLALWTCQRPADVLRITVAATEGGRLRMRQRKTGAAINIPLLPPASAARRLALAVRSASGYDGDLLIVDAPLRRGYVRVTPRGVDCFKRFNRVWCAARALAALKVPSLAGGTRNSFGDLVPPLHFADARDTAVTRLFAAMHGQDGALASIATWHGSGVETLVKLLQHYLVLDPSFADQAGAALGRHARAMGMDI